MDARPRQMFHSLLRDIAEHPDEDDLRLVLADWLDENGTKRGHALMADTIRAEVAAAAALGDLDDPPPPPPRVLKAWADVLGLPLRVLGLDRGVPDDILMSRHDFTRLGTAAVGLLPIYALSLGPSGGRALAAATFNCPALERVVELTLPRGGPSDEDLDALVESPHLRRSLRVLYLGRRPVGEFGAHALLTSRALPDELWLGVNLGGVSAPMRHAMRERFRSAEDQAFWTAAGFVCVGLPPKQGRRYRALLARVIGDMRRRAVKSHA